jgi:site-specific DNA-methyltransferase (adenine-specific)
MQGLPDACIPLTVTSPPYDQMRAYGGHPFNFDPIAQELFRVTMPGGVVVWIVQDQIVGGSETGTHSRQRLFFQDLGFHVHGTMIMASKGQPYPSKVRYPSTMQFAYIFSKGAPRTVNLICDKKNTTAGGFLRKNIRQTDGEVRRVTTENRIKGYGVRSSIWEYNVGGMKSTKDRFAHKHPAIMPELMAEDHILSWSLPGDLVFDPMAGSGTTCKMAVLNHRKFLGMEIHKPYWKIACNRIALAKEEHRQKLLEWLRTSSDLFGSRTSQPTTG